MPGGYYVSKRIMPDGFHTRLLWYGIIFDSWLLAELGISFSAKWTLCQCNVSGLCIHCAIPFSAGYFFFIAKGNHNFLSAKLASNPDSFSFGMLQHHPCFHFFFAVAHRVSLMLLMFQDTFEITLPNSHISKQYNNASIPQSKTIVNGNS